MAKGPCSPDFDYKYPYTKLANKFGPNFTHSTFNRDGDRFRPNKVDYLRNYSGDSVFDYDDITGKTYLVPSLKSIKPLSWLSPENPQDDVIIEFDGIRNFNKHSRIEVSRGILKGSKLLTAYTHDDVFDWTAKTSGDNCWSSLPESLAQSVKRLPPYSVAAINASQGEDPMTLLLFSGPQTGVQPSDGIIILNGYEPSIKTPIHILA